jgi:FimV-like protein
MNYKLSSFAITPAVALQVAALQAVALLSGCAALSQPKPTNDNGTTIMPASLLDATQKAATAQVRVSQVVEIQSMPPLVKVAASSIAAVHDRITMHWNGPANAMVKQLAEDMGWRYDITNHHPMPALSIFATNRTINDIVGIANSQLAHTAYIHLDHLTRTILLNNTTLKAQPTIHPVMPPSAHPIMVHSVTLPLAHPAIRHPAHTVLQHYVQHPARILAHPFYDWAMSKRFGPVQAGQTLWEITQMVNASHFSTAQVMIAIFKANPSCFINHNPNLLKQGVTLKMPSLQQIQKLTIGQAFYWLHLHRMVNG